MFGGVPKAEVDELAEFWSAFPNLKRTLFVDNGTPFWGQAYRIVCRETVA